MGRVGYVRAEFVMGRVSQSSLLWWELGTNSLITGPGEWLSFRRFTSNYPDPDPDVPCLLCAELSLNLRKYETILAESNVYIMLRRMATESEDIGKALKSVIDKINFASQHRPKVHAEKL